MSTPVIAPNFHIGNYTLLFSTLKHIEDNFESWYQGAWCKIYPDNAGTACKTVRCVAGWIAHFAGWIEIRPEGDRTFRDATKDGETTRIEIAALQALGLNPERYPINIVPPPCGCCEGNLDDETQGFALRLFGASNDWYTVLREVEWFAEQDEVELPEWFAEAKNKAWRCNL